MKNIIISCLFPVAAAVLLSGCDNAEYKAQANSLYLADAVQNTKSASIEMDGDVDIQILVRLAQKTDRDVEVELGFNPANIDEYNDANGTEYTAMPEDMLPSGVVVTIPAGEVSASYTLHIDDFDTGSLTYAVPVQLGNVISGDVPVSRSQGKYIYVLLKPLVVSVPVMSANGDNRVDAAPETDWGITTDAWTLEAWIRMDGYSINNQAVFNTGSSDHEIYIRFGDANSPYNYLQIKTLGDGGLNTSSDLEANVWYHWAFVYSTSDKTIRIYRDGEQVGFKEVPEPNGGTVRFDYMQMISSGSYFRNNCAMSQVRLWKVARTQTEIQNNMYFPINTNNANLIACWPMDEGSGNVFYDATGNGHDATAGDGVIRRWEDGVRFDAE